MALQIHTNLGFPGTFDRARPSRTRPHRFADFNESSYPAARRRVQKALRRPMLTAPGGGIGTVLFFTAVYTLALLLLVCSLLNSAAGRLMGAHAHGGGRLDVLAYGLE